MLVIDENRQRQEAFRNLITDLGGLFSPLQNIENKNHSLEENMKTQKIFEDVRLISLVGRALTNYIFMTHNFVDLYDQKRREVIYELATPICQSKAQMIQEK